MFYIIFTEICCLHHLSTLVSGMSYQFSFPVIEPSQILMRANLEEHQRYIFHALYGIGFGRHDL